MSYLEKCNFPHVLVLAILMNFPLLLFYLSSMVLLCIIFFSLAPICQTDGWQIHTD